MQNVLVYIHLLLHIDYSLRAITRLKTYSVGTPTHVTNHRVSHNNYYTPYHCSGF